MASRAQRRPRLVASEDHASPETVSRTRGLVNQVDLAYERIEQMLVNCQLKPGRFNVWGTMLAIYLLGTGIQGLQLAGGELWVTDAFNGVALIGAVSLALLLQRRRGRREKLAAAGG